MKQNRIFLAFSLNIVMVTFVGILLVALFVGMVGCGSAYEVPPQTSQDLLNLRDHVIESKAQIQKTSNAARDLIQRPQQNLTSQIMLLGEHIATLNSMSTRGRQMYTGAELHATDYFADWDRQLKSMSDDLAAAGQKRLGQSIASFKTLQLQVLDVRGFFQPYMAKLLEVQQYLRTDTTAAGVKAVTPMIKDALGREPDIMKRADQIIKQIDNMRGGQ